MTDDGAEPDGADDGAEPDGAGDGAEPDGADDGAEPDGADEGTDTATDGETAPDSADADEEIPLQIAGHEDRAPPGGEGVDAFSFSEGNGESEPAAAEPSDGTERPAEESAQPADPARVTDARELDEGAADDEDVEPVELLVQLAKDGEIDPWDIDIVSVTDKFLEALDERDLRTSGRALFYASVLLRMKSDALFAVDEPDDEGKIPPWEAPFADDAMEAPEEGHPPGYDPIEALEAEMDRRLERKHARGTPETLDELVRDLREAERGSWWKESRSYDTSGSPRGWDRGVQELSYHSGDDYRVDEEPTADDVTHTQHDEDIESVIDDVEAALEFHYEQGREEVLYAEIEQAGGSRVMTYLALLFLAHRGRLVLEQDELFGDLWIQQATVDAEEPSEAVAD